MPGALQALVVALDQGVREEWLAALGSVKGVRVRAHVEADLRQGRELARHRRPDLICLELTTQLAAVRDFVEDVQADSRPLIVGSYRDGMQGGAGGSPFLVQALRAGVHDFVRCPVSSVELEEILERRLGREGLRSSASGSVVTFFSCKGGVGKSTLSVNTALLLARRNPDRVLLVDASLQMGVCASMLNLEPETTLYDAALDLDRLDGMLVRRLSTEHESGLRVLTAPRDASEAVQVDKGAIDRILAVARREFDFVVVDTFPVLDGVVLAILDLADLVYVTFTPTVPVVLGIRSFFDVLDKVGVSHRKCRTIANTNYPSFRGELKLMDVAARLEREIDHRFPFTKLLLTAANIGDPSILPVRKLSRFGRSLHRLVQEVEALGSGTSVVEDERLRSREPSSEPDLSTSPPGPGTEREDDS